MKKKLILILAYTCLSSSITTPSQSWQSWCTVKITQALINAYPIIIETAAASLTAQGDPVAAQLLYDIQMRKPVRQLACEAGAESVSGLLSQVVKSLTPSASSASIEAIKAALSAAAYSVMHQFVTWKLW